MSVCRVRNRLPSTEVEAAVSDNENVDPSLVSDLNTSVEDLKDDMRQFVAERDWRQFHSPKNLSMSIAIEAAELMSIFSG